MIEHLEIKNKDGKELTANEVKDQLQPEFQDIGMSGIFVLENFKYEK